MLDHSASLPLSDSGIPEFTKFSAGSQASGHTNVMPGSTENTYTPEDNMALKFIPTEDETRETLRQFKAIILKEQDKFFSFLSSNSSKADVLLTWKDRISILVRAYNQAELLHYAAILSDHERIYYISQINKQQEQAVRTSVIFNRLHKAAVIAKGMPKMMRDMPIMLSGRKGGINASF